MAKYFYKSPEHKARLAQWIQESSDKVYRGKIDSEYGAALYILSADDEIWEKSTDYISDHGILFDKMLKEVDLSSGYATLVKLARDLFRSSRDEDAPLGIIEFMNLDEANFAVALTAIRIRRYPPLVDDLAHA